MSERETLEVDVLIVGAGPAGLSTAIRLAQLQKAAGSEPLSIAVLEKAREAGAHMLSGAVLDPSAERVQMAVKHSILSLIWFDAALVAATAPLPYAMAVAALRMIDAAESAVSH